MSWSRSSFVTARWSQNSGVSPLYWSIIPSAPSGLSKANWNSLLSCMGISIWGGRGIAQGVKKASLLWPLSKHGIHHVLLLQSENNDVSVALLPLIHLIVGRTDWLNRELTSHNSELFCSELMSHLCSQLYSIHWLYPGTVTLAVCWLCHVKCKDSLVQYFFWLNDLHWHVGKQNSVWPCQTKLFYRFSESYVLKEPFEKINISAGHRLKMINVIDLKIFLWWIIFFFRNDLN